MVRLISSPSLPPSLSVRYVELQERIETLEQPDIIAQVEAVLASVQADSGRLIGVNRIVCPSGFSGRLTLPADLLSTMCTVGAALSANDTVAAGNVQTVKDSIAFLERISGCACPDCVVAGSARGEFKLQEGADKDEEAKGVATGDDPSGRFIGVNRLVCPSGFSGPLTLPPDLLDAMRTVGAALSANDTVAAGTVQTVKESIAFLERISGCACPDCVAAGTHRVDESAEGKAD